ncbi:hypothetical protein CDAR_563331 [Caerostris darwini]|uniref:Uncharacterized protein n=1 Tax=Caerostris darwini TaxID=1538125 RepID=A0AAV4QSN4_9ARAC|nr:hypothetical protein CDAR_563331 [Caerostris darwini]
MIAEQILSLIPPVPEKQDTHHLFKIGARDDIAHTDLDGDRDKKDSLIAPGDHLLNAGDYLRSRINACQFKQKNPFDRNAGDYIFFPRLWQHRRFLAGQQRSSSNCYGIRNNLEDKTDGVGRTLEVIRDELFCSTATTSERRCAAAKIYQLANTAVGKVPSE